MLKLRKLNFKKDENKEVQVAVATGRHRISFRDFCKMVANHTTFSAEEVAAVINLATSTARDITTSGDSVEFGDMGTLTPYLKSRAVPKGEKFNPAKHINGAIVRLIQSRKYFTLDEAHFEHVLAPEPKKPKPPKP